MASIYDLKPRFQALLRPTSNWFAAHGVTANQVTIYAVVMSLAVGGLIAVFPTNRQMLLLLPFVLFARMAFNAIDGMLAREHGMKSRLGAVLNELGDVIADAGLYLPLALVPGVSAWLVVVAVLLGVICEMAGVVAVQVGAARRYDGPLGKSDRALVFGAIGALLGCGLKPGRWLDLVLAGVVLMSVVTIVNRSRKALAVDRPQEDG
jgi:CDP-diacylglycerol--glycerol-3-phosphate 3-phosphatidyltransferase